MAKTVSARTLVIRYLRVSDSKPCRTPGQGPMVPLPFHISSNRGLTMSLQVTKKNVSLFSSVYGVFDFFFLCLGHFYAERQVMGN